MNNNEYYARFAIVRNSDNHNVKWQLLEEHLGSVSELSSKKAKLCGGNADFIEAARIAGLLHDIGKYDSFQKRIRLLAKNESAPSARHAYFGALIAYKYWLDVAFAVLGHHAGIPDYAELSLASRNEENRASVEKLLANPAVKAECRWLENIPKISNRKKLDNSLIDLRTRMLLSCLVDADRTDSANFEYGPDVIPLTELKATELLARLNNHMETLRKGKPDTPLNRLRNKIFHQCLNVAKTQNKLFSLSVPTGGGKTLSSMAFALSHALAYQENVRRIIVVIPYLSIIEQNARVYREVFGKEFVLEHHSGGIQDEPPSQETDRGHLDENTTSFPTTRGHDHALLRENWDAPIVVTTSVRFFESLFSNKPGDLRRAHNIARSVVIFDEVQTFPREYLEPILSMIKGLAEDWDTTFLFCTATQPAFEKHPAMISDDRRWEPGTIKPVLPPEFTKELFQSLQRVKTPVWPAIEDRISWDVLSEELLSHNRVLCIVNTRPHAVELYRQVLEKAPDSICEKEAIFHLSTRMCPRHRLKVLDTIRNRLKIAEKPCIVVSTQLVEAGVDIDFPVVYRAFGPFDAMIQAAGRCNREGILNSDEDEPGGRFHVFNPLSDVSPYKYAVDTTRMMFSKGTPSLYEPDHVNYYFQKLYSGSELDEESIEALRKQLCFATVAKRFEMIKNTGRSVLVPYNEEAKKLISHLQNKNIPSRSLFRTLQQFTVSLTESDFEKGLRAKAIQEVTAGSESFFIKEAFYSEQLGVNLNV